MEKAIIESGDLVLYGRCRESSQDKPTETYVKRFEDNGDEIIIAMRKCSSPSVKSVGLRSRGYIETKQTTKITTQYSVKVNGKVARSREEAEEAVQRVTGLSIPRNSQVITGISMFKEMEKNYPQE